MTETKSNKFINWMYNIKHHAANIFGLPLFIYCIVMLTTGMSLLYITVTGDPFKTQVMSLVFFIYLVYIFAYMAYSEGFYKFTAAVALLTPLTKETIFLYFAAAFFAINLILRYIWIFKQAKDEVKKRMDNIYNHGDKPK